MAVKKAGIADVLGVPADQLEGNIRIRPPVDPEKSRRSHDREMYVLSLTWRIALAAMVLCLLLCILFLHYGKPEQAEKVVATVIGVVGGIGIGRASMSKDD